MLRHLLTALFRGLQHLGAGYTGISPDRFERPDAERQDE